MEFQWKDIKVTMLGRTFERITDVTYEKEIEKKAIYGRGSKVKGVQQGNEKNTGDLTLGQSEVEAMLLAAKATNPMATILDLSFDIQVQYQQGDDLIKDRIIGAQFTKLPKGMKQGDTDMNIKLPYIAEDILYNI